MTPEQILTGEGIFSGMDTIGGISCSIGYIKKFKWSWLATQLNTFIIIGETDSTIDKAFIESFSTACYNYAIKNNKGWPRGLQSAVASIAILKGDKIESSAIQFCETLTKKHWGAFEIPVLYNTRERNCIRFKKNPVWGRIYFTYLAKVIDDLAKKF